MAATARRPRAAARRRCRPPLRPLSRSTATPASLPAALASTLTRLRDGAGTWKLWTWPGGWGGEDGEHAADAADAATPSAPPPTTRHTFDDGTAFREWARAHVLPSDLAATYLPPVEAAGAPRAPETPGEAALRERMARLLARVQKVQSAPAGCVGDDTDDEAGGDEAAPAPPARGGKKKKVGDAGAAKDGAPPDGKPPPPPAPPQPPPDPSQNMAAAMEAVRGLEAEHEFLYAAIAAPVAAFVCACLPPNRRLSTPTELVADDFASLAPDDVAKLADWLIEKVDALGAKTRLDDDDDAAATTTGDDDDGDDESIGDVDLFTLVEAADAVGGRPALTVNPRWLAHLSRRVLGDDGAPRPARPGEDPHACGLVLEWVYGTIVSTAEKARDCARKRLGPHTPTRVAAGDALAAALRAQADRDARVTDSTQLLRDVLTCRRRVWEDREGGHDVSPVAAGVPVPVAGGAPAAAAFAAAAAAAASRAPVPGAPASTPLPPGAPPPPDAVLARAARREVLLTRAKLAVLAARRADVDACLRRARAALRTAEPEVERARRELEALKQTKPVPPPGAPGGGGGDRRGGAGDAVSSHVDAQAALQRASARRNKEHAALVRAQQDAIRADREHAALVPWLGNAADLAAALEALAEGGDVPPPSVGAPTAGAASSTPAPAKTPTELRDAFMGPTRAQLYTDADDVAIVKELSAVLKAERAALAAGRAALAALENALAALACDDPGARVGSVVALPLIAERLDAAAAARADARAHSAAADLLADVQAEEERAAADKERRRAARARDAEKKREEREKAERERAARDAETAAARAVADAAAAEAAAAAAAARDAARAEALAADDAAREARRLELLHDPAFQAEAAARAAADARARELLTGGGGGARRTGTKGARTPSADTTPAKPGSAADAPAPGTPQPALVPPPGAPAAPPRGGGERGTPSPPTASPPHGAQAAAHQAAHQAAASLRAGAVVGQQQPYGVPVYGAPPPPGYFPAAGPPPPYAGPRPGRPGRGPFPATAPPPPQAPLSPGGSASTALRASAAPFVPSTSSPPPAASPPSPARLARGLANEAGDNSCFLNAAVQALWHLPRARASLLALDPSRLSNAGAPPAELAVLAELRALLAALAARAAPTAPTPVPPASAARLRAAVAALKPAFGSTDMQDAAEVLGEILAALHRAEAVGGEPDPLLPTRAPLPPVGAALPPPRAAVSTVMRLFGQDVLAPVDGGKQVGDDSAAASGGGGRGRRTRDANGWSSAATPAPAPRDRGAAEPDADTLSASSSPPPAPRDGLQYVQYFKLVPAAGLRSAAEAAPPGTPFESVLRSATRGGGRGAGVPASNGASAPPQPAAATAPTAITGPTLLRRPAVLALALVWDSARAAPAAVAAVARALSPTLDAASLFDGAPAGPPHTLRSIVCYSGHHYRAYAQEEGDRGSCAGAWTRLDDAAVTHVGGWPDVAAAIAATGEQPALLFYEDAVVVA